MAWYTRRAGLARSAARTARAEAQADVAAALEVGAAGVGPIAVQHKTVRVEPVDGDEDATGPENVEGPQPVPAADEIERDVDMLQRCSEVDLPMLDRMTETFIEMVNLTDKQLDVLGKLLEAKSMDEVRSSRKEIERLEEAGDELKDSGFDEMYDNRKLFDYFSFQHYTEVLRKLDDIQDRVEDMSDLILAIANTISR